MLSLAVLSLSIWIYLLLARGGFWRIGRSLRSADAHELDPARSRTPTVVAVIPARDEAALIGLSVGSLLRQSYPGPLHVIVVDDHSTDGTAAAARAIAAPAPPAPAVRSVTVIGGAPLPEGWTGKLFALAQGIEAARAWQPDYLLLTDADIRHDADSVGTLVAAAQRDGRDLVSRMALLSTETPAERWLLPAFVFFFFLIYPPAWVGSRRRTVAAAAGGCVLLRPEALERAGGVRAIRGRIIDDCALADAVKSAGGSILLGPTRSVHSLRRLGSWRQIGRMISRTAFNQLRHSYLLLCLTLLGLSVTFLLPPLLCLSGRPALVWTGAAGWALMSIAYAPMVRFYRQGPLWSLSLPLIAAFYGIATVHSALCHARGRGGEWKGRLQDPSHARR